MRPLRDPAPSRLAYRLHRLSLTPSVRRFATYGLPLLTLLLIAGVSLADGARREAVVALYRDAMLEIRQREEFQVRVMAIEGASDATDATIRDLVPIAFPVSSFDLDLAAMKRQIEALDAVERADLRIRSGGVLDMEIRERRPALVWRHREGIWLLDAGGHRTAGVGARAARPDLPLVTGAGADAAAAEALGLVAAAGPLSDRLIGLVRVGERRWDMALSGGVLIRLPAAGAREALGRALALHEAEGLFDRRITHVDLRLPGRPTVGLVRDDAAELRRTKLTALGDL